MKVWVVIVTADKTIRYKMAFNTEQDAREYSVDILAHELWLRGKIDSEESIKIFKERYGKGMKRAANVGGWFFAGDENTIIVRDTKFYEKVKIAVRELEV